MTALTPAQKRDKFYASCSASKALRLSLINAEAKNSQKKVTPSVNKQKKLNYYAKMATDESMALKYFFNAARKGAATRNIEFTLVASDLVDLWKQQKGLCVVSKIPMTLFHGTPALQNPNKISVDRIDSAIGYHRHNIQLITWQANSAKNVWSQEQLISFCNVVAEANK